MLRFLTAAIVVVCCVAPLAWLIGAIAFTPDAWVEFRLDKFRVDLLARTIAYNFAAGLVATLLAIPVALVVGRGRTWLATIIAFVLPIGLLIPSITYAYGWTQFFRLINLQMIPAEPLDVARCVWSLATWLWPIPAAAMGIALRRMDSNLQQQALLDGALGRITARQMLAPAITGFACVAALAMQEFAVYEPSGVSVVATEVRMVFDTGAISSTDNPITAPMSGDGVWSSPDQAARSAAAAATATPMILVVLALAGVAGLGARKFAASDEIESEPWPKILNAGFFTVLLATAVIFITLVVPIGAMVLSLKRKIDPLFIWHQFSPQVIGSSLVAGMTGVVAMIVALRATAKYFRWGLVVAVLAFLVGGQLLAIAQIRIYNRPVMGWIYNNFPIVVMTHFARFGWIALLAAAATWSRPWKSLRDIAAVDGADRFQIATKIVWPLAWPMLLAAGLVVGCLSLTEVPATVLIAPQRPPMLVPTMMSWLHIQRFDAMIEGSLLMVVMVSVVGIICAGLSKIGIRVFASLKHRRPAMIFCLVLLLPIVSGCGDPKKPEAIWCETGNGPGQVVYPRGISYSKSDDTFFIVDRMARVQHLDDRGKCLNDWRMPDWKLGRPVGLSVGPDGNLYVPDTHYQRIMVYKPDGTLLRQWGGPGKKDGEFIFPTDVAFDSTGKIFVSEYGDNDRIQVFDGKGKFLYAFGKFGAGDGEFARPQSMVIEGDLIYITDACNHRIAVFKTDGTFVRNMGSVGSGLGQFRFPYGLDADSQGHLIVCEFGNNRVQLIDKETGRGIKTWGVGGREPGELAYPWGVAVDKKDRVIAVDAGNNRLQVFEF